jgi:maleate isomerase
MTLSRGRARVGVLVPFTNCNLEPDLTLLRPQGLSYHFTRIGGYDEDEVPDADQMHGMGAAEFDEPLRLLMGAKPDVILYGCTSATLTHGLEFDRGLAEKIRSNSGAKTVTAAGALANALKWLGVSRIGFASPYVPQINDLAVNFLEATGVTTINRSEVNGKLDNVGQGALEPDDVFKLGLAADHRDAEALVLSCTDMRSVETIARLEDAVGKPVITSNQAMIFETLQLLEIDDPIEGYGMLLKGART